MPSPIKAVIDLVKDRELKQKALSDKVGSTAPIKISSAFIACKKCGRRALRARWEEHFFVCPHCGNYAAIGAYYRLSMLYDAGTFQELDKEIEVRDPLSFPEYKEKVLALEKKTGLKEAVVSSKGKIGGMPVVVIVMDSRFLMGSMSDSVGEKITRGVEEADREHCPLIIFSASGGARMQEGIFSLMQMAKTAAAIQLFSEHGGLFISFLTHPTTGGVTASFATLGDITLAEPGALIGFAGPRVIEQTINSKLPKGFQRSEYLEQHGFIDKIVGRKEMRDTLIQLLSLHED
jgi:acetyl-coA carboxylase, carboxyl transferase, beta subunit